MSGKDCLQLRLFSKRDFAKTTINAMKSSHWFKEIYRLTRFVIQRETFNGKGLHEEPNWVSFRTQLSVVAYHLLAHILYVTPWQFPSLITAGFDKFEANLTYWTVSVSELHCLCDRKGLSKWLK